jgi:hypothetical protein
MEKSGPSSGREEEARPPNDGSQPYSPSGPTDDVEDMDWDSNLPGVKNLFASPSQNRKDGEVPAKEGNTSEIEDSEEGARSENEEGEDAGSRGSNAPSSDSDSDS